MTLSVKRFLLVLTMLILPPLMPAATAADSVTLNISLKDHKFEPAELQAPANKALTIVVKNLDPAPAEFESHALKVEKVVVAKGTITVRVRPQSPGRYRFFDDFHSDTEGYLVVK